MRAAAAFSVVVLGVALVVLGVGLAYPPAAVVLAGLGLSAVGLLVDTD